MSYNKLEESILYEIVALRYKLLAIVGFC